MVDHKTAFSNELGRTDVEGLYCVHLSTSFTPLFLILSFVTQAAVGGVEEYFVT